jgi:hypothetical protein
MLRILELTIRTVIRKAIYPDCLSLKAIARFSYFTAMLLINAALFLFFSERVNLGQKYWAVEGKKKDERHWKS